MENVFFKIHSRIISSVTRFLYPHTRKFLEYLVLFLAVSLCVFQIYIHLRFLDPLTAKTCLLSALNREGLDIRKINVLQLHVPHYNAKLNIESSQVHHSIEQSSSRGLISHLDSWTEKNNSNISECPKAERVFLFSLEKGFLMLNQKLRETHKISTGRVTIKPLDKCFGPTNVHFLIDKFVGYDTIVTNWFISVYGGKGFLYNVQSKEVVNLNHAGEFGRTVGKFETLVLFKIGVVLTTFFLFFTTTSLVSFTLRETQVRMLKFTYLLQHHVRNRLPYAPLICTHVVESLVFVPIMVGILFFLFEFFSDQLLAFMVLSTVWMCEVYSVISVRTAPTICFFPRVFLICFTLYHIYFFSFPFGFSFLALVDTVLFLVYSMLYFWNQFEIPALQSGVISVVRTRMIEIFPSGLTQPVFFSEQASVATRNEGTRAQTPQFPSSILREDPRRNLGRQEPWFPFNLFQNSAHHPSGSQSINHSHLIQNSPSNINPSPISSSNANIQQAELPWPFNMFLPPEHIHAPAIRTDSNVSQSSTIAVYENIPDNAEEPWFWDLFVHRGSRANSRDNTGNNAQVNGQEELVPSDTHDYNLTSHPDSQGISAPLPTDHRDTLVLLGGGEVLSSNDSETAHHSKSPPSNNSPPFPFNLFVDRNEQTALKFDEQRSNNEIPSNISDVNSESNHLKHKEKRMEPPHFPFNLFGEHSHSNEKTNQSPNSSVDSASIGSNKNLNQDMFGKDNEQNEAMSILSNDKLPNSIKLPAAPFKFFADCPSQIVPGPSHSEQRRHSVSGNSTSLKESTDHLSGKFENFQLCEEHQRKNTSRKVEIAETVISNEEWCRTKSLSLGNKRLESTFDIAGFSQKQSVVP